MKLGFITAILDSWTYEEMMDFASEQGFECVEVACWPQEKAERRYAGVSHIDAERVNREDAYAEHIVEYAKKSGVEISVTGLLSKRDGCRQREKHSCCGTPEAGDPCK